MMVVYHGTSLDRAIRIARSGRILSPLQRAIEEAQREYAVNPTLYRERHGDPAEFAEKRMRQLYAEHEFEHRVLCVSVIAGEIGRARTHATSHDVDGRGGLVLGIEKDEEELRRLTPHFETGSLIFIPKYVALRKLKEVHLSPVAFDSFDLITEVFKPFNPTYELLS